MYDYKIGSFNVNNMSFRSDPDKFKYIAEIIKDQKYQIVALQEVLTEGKVWKTIDEQKRRFLRYYLGKDWEFCWAAPDRFKSSAPEDKRGEGYAFLWDKRFFTIPEYIKSPTDIREFEPRIVNQSENDVRARLPKMARMPFYGRFIPVRGPFIEIRLINTHIFSGKNLSSDIAIRKEEFSTLVRNVLPGIGDNVYGQNRRPYTVLLGDYNLSVRDKDIVQAVSGLNTDIDEFVFLDNGKAIKTIQKEKSTLKDPAGNKGNETAAEESQDYSNSFDHFSVDISWFEAEGVRIEASRLDVRNALPNGVDLETYYKKISDHAPVELNISMR